VDIKSVCGTVNLGSNPSTLANLRSDNMNEIKIKIKEEREETGTNCRIISINGISGFWKHPRHENCWIYNGRMPMANCWIFISDNSIQILNVMVHNPDDRRSGFGSQMVSDIRCAFPNTSIWVDSWNCSRPFWTKMMQREKIDFIANDYSWPCSNTTCQICHKLRPSHTRRTVFD
jgi:hypothetical protein